MFGAYFVLVLLGLLAAGLVWWVIAGVIGDRRRARVAARYAVRYQRTTETRAGDEP